MRPPLPAAWERREVRGFVECVLTNAGLGPEHATGLGLGDLLHRVTKDGDELSLRGDEACHFGALVVADLASPGADVLLCTGVSCPGRPTLEL